jgi:hypothetical protein
MGNIGPSRQHYDVMPVPAFGIEDADHWTADSRRLSAVAEPAPSPDPGPLPDPDPVPSPPSDLR